MNRLIFILLFLYANNCVSAIKDIKYYVNLYNQFVAGKVDYDKLSDEDKKFLITAISRNNNSCENLHGDCKDACEKSESAANELIDDSENLTKCAKRKDFTDECRNQFNSTRNSQSDYEDAVDRFQVECH